MKFNLVPIIGLFLANVTLVGCISNSETWKHEYATANQVRKDESLCRIQAYEKIDDNHRDDIGYSPENVINKATQYNALMNQYDLRRNFQKTLETCLTRRGYKKHDSD